MNKWGKFVFGQSLISEQGIVRLLPKTLRQKTPAPLMMRRGKPNLKRACLKITASNRNIMRIWAAVYIRSMWK